MFQAGMSAVTARPQPPRRRGRRAAPQPAEPDLPPRTAAQRSAAAAPTRRAPPDLPPPPASAQRDAGKKAGADVCEDGDGDDAGARRGVVLTPWYPDGVSKRQVQLRTEAEALAALVSLTPEEAAARSALVARVERALCAADAAAGGGGAPRGVVRGSHAIGLAAPETAVDLCVAGVAPALLTGSGALLRALAGLHGDGVELRSFGVVAGRAVAELVAAPPAPPPPGGEAAAPVTLRLQVDADAAVAAEAEREVEVMRGWLAEYPCIPAAHAVLRHTFAQGGNLDAAAGGLGPEALLAMIAAAIVGFCELYGDGFDFAASVVDARSPGGAAPRALGHWDGDALVVVDPSRPAVNLARGCYRLPALRASLRSAAFMLQRWKGSRRGCYKGRTPLSGLISYRTLWCRSRLHPRVHRGAASPPPAPPATPPPVCGDATAASQVREEGWGGSPPPALHLRPGSPVPVSASPGPTGSPGLSAADSTLASPELEMSWQPLPSASSTEDLTAAAAGSSAPADDTPLGAGDGDDDDMPPELLDLTDPDFA